MGMKHGSMTLNCKEKKISVECHDPTSSWKMKFKTTPSAGTVMTPPFRDAKGVILADMPCGQTIN
jgi:hypothetical protein